MYPTTGAGFPPNIIILFYFLKFLVLLVDWFMDNYCFLY